MPSDDYWLAYYQCIANAYYNVYYLGNQKKMKVRFGGVYRYGQPIFGVNVDVSVRKYEYKDSHCWVETNDGKVIDWVLNDLFGTTEKKIWDMSYVKEQGVEYKYFTHEKAIEKKANKTWKAISDTDRHMRGEMGRTRGEFDFIKPPTQ